MTVSPTSEQRPSPPPLLEMRGIRKSFAGTEVLHGVDLQLGAGEVLALLGENGAGKSTLIKILNGDYTKDAGQILLAGRPVEFRAPRDAQQAGIRVIYQELNDAPELSAAENVLLGQLPRRARWFVDWPRALRRAGEVLAALNADFPPQRPMRRLSVGQRQLVEIAKALAVDPAGSTSAARVLVMDEPTAALTPREVDVLFETIGSLRRQGVGIVYISHRLDEVRRVAQRVMVLRDGSVAGVVAASEVGRGDIVRMMVGRDVKRRAGQVEAATPPARREGAAALGVSRLSRGRAFHDVTFDVRPGENVGLFGLLGAGHLEVTRALFGADPADAGEVQVNGVPVSIRSPRGAMRHGIALVSEDRKLDALVPVMSVADNLMLANWSAVATAGIVSPSRQLARAREWVGRLGVRLKSGVRQPIATLSGGNQQKVILARWLEAGVKVLLLNEPTRGVDVGARADIYALLDELRAKGLAVVVCSSDLEEILDVSDRILVFAKGRLVAQFDRTNADQESLLASAAADSENAD